MSMADKNRRIRRGVKRSGRYSAARARLQADNAEQTAADLEYWGLPREARAERNRAARLRRIADDLDDKKPPRA